MSVTWTNLVNTMDDMLQQQQRKEGRRREAQLRQEALRKEYEAAQAAVAVAQNHVTVLSDLLKAARKRFEEVSKEATKAEMDLGECLQHSL